MRSSRDIVMAALFAGAAAFAATAAGCGAGEDSPGGGSSDPHRCQTSYLDYESFGKPFLLDWCTGCHSAAVPATMRQNAPTDVNLDTLEGARRFAERITVRAAGSAATMPPAGGPSAEERALLAEWISCGAK
jgi:uncharacterized membrane protein